MKKHIILFAHIAISLNYAFSQKVANTIEPKNKVIPDSIENIKNQVNPSPADVLVGNTISKTTGFNATVSLPADSPLSGIGFTILGGELSIGNESIPFSGSIVQPSYIEKLKLGKEVVIHVYYKRKGDPVVRIASSTLTVVQ